MLLGIAKMKNGQKEESGVKRELRPSLIYSVHRWLLQFIKSSFEVAEIAVPMQAIG